MFLPDAKTIIYTKDWSEIWAMDPDGGNQRRHLMGTVKPWSVCLQADGKAIFFVDHSNKLKKVSAKGGEPTEIDWQAEIHRNERDVQKASFGQAWAARKERWQISYFPGGDWKTVYRRYAPYCDGTLMKEDLHHLIRRMIGELNVSHTWVSDTPLGAMAGATELPDLMNTSPLTGCLGITADPEHRGPGMRVADVIPGGPADQQGSTIALGEYIMAVEGEDVADNEDFHRRLNGRTDEHVKLLVNKEAKLEGARDISIEPVSIATINNLRYKRWVRSKREIVQELSDGRVYYTHIEGMFPGPAGERFPLEHNRAYLECDALLVDVRNAVGGTGFEDVLDLLARSVNVWRAGPGAKLHPWPKGHFDGPKAVLINQTCQSGSEIFAYLFREEGLGKLIGTATEGAAAGWADEVELADGSYVGVALPGVVTVEGLNMENTGVQPDVEVPYPYEAYRDGKDPQIEAAVQVLLEELKEHPRARPPEVDW